MNQSLILAIDQGGQSSRVAVYTEDGEQLYCFSAPCATSHRYVEGSEYIEQDPQEILSGIKNCLEKIERVLGDNTQHIIAAGFAGQGSSLLCWDNKTGEALSPVLSWQDVRGQNFLESFPLTSENIRVLTGLRASPHYGASKIRWCLDNNPAVQAALKINTVTVGPIVSFIFWHLCGENAVDPGHAQRTLLWNLQTNNWDETLLNMFKIPRKILPVCRWHNSNFGNFHLANNNIPFVASARDQGASLFSRGFPDKSACYINIGTGAFIQRVADNFNAPEGLLVSPLWLPEQCEEEIPERSSPTCYLDELTNDFKSISLRSRNNHLYAWEATVNGAASATAFIQQNTALQITPEEIDTALKIDSVKNGYFLNAVGGLGAPYWRTDLTSRFSENLSAHEKIFVWLESIIFQITVNVKLMNQLGAAQKIYISGGLSNADSLCQKISDLTQLPVYRSENADATLQGIACMAAGIPTNWNAAHEKVIFAPRENKTLQKKFEYWQQLMSDWLVD